ncbi:MAG TPA: RidA family protein [Candidatus Binataceae bacterium]|nr:RidA family protein [Candidatus Binataceae bacterium]
MDQIARISSGTPWEPIAGYSRAVRYGDLVAVSGTTATDEHGTIVGAGQMYVQARQALSNLRSALERMGLGIGNVVRTRMFVTDIGRFADAARAHRECFGATPPATTMVEVRRLVDARMLIEIEADAYAPEPVRSAPEAPVKVSAPVPTAIAKKRAPAPRKPPKLSAAKKSKRRK